MCTRFCFTMAIMIHKVKFSPCINFWQAARALLHGGADVNARTVKGNTPLLFACNAGHSETAQVNPQTQTLNPQPYTPSKLGTHKTVKARFWPWLEPF